jgi:Tfp pilus assembly protein PilF
VARQYNELAESLRQNHQLTSEIDNLQRAVSLDPDYFQAHYNLGSAYEEVLDFDHALGEYQRAHIGEPNADAVTNNLARLLILRRNDFAGALSILDPALERPFDKNDAQQVSVRYTLLKNRAWALLGLKLPELAEDDLRSAIRLRPKAPAAYCLLGQVLEAQASATKPIAEWESCLRYQRADNPPQVEASWLATARQRVRDEGSAHAS